MGRIINDDEHYGAGKPYVLQNRSKYKHEKQTKRISRKKNQALISCSPTDLSCISVKLLKRPRLPALLTHPQGFDVHEESERKRIEKRKLDNNIKMISW